MFESLEASFESALARDEDRAAADLAFSLSQDRALGDSLSRSGPLAARLDGQTLPIVEVGEDYVATGGGADTLIALDHLVAVPSAVPTAPVGVDRRFLEVLRGWTRRGVSVQVRTLQGKLSGGLVRAAPDHLVIRQHHGDAFVARAAVIAVRSLPRGLTDVS